MHMKRRLVYWLLEGCQYSILVAFASVTGKRQYNRQTAVRLVLLQCFGVLH
jgi:hypothetical protein